MGGNSSKTALPTFQALDPMMAKYDAPYVTQLQAANQAAAQAAYKAAQTAYGAASTWKTVAYSVVGIAIAVLVGISIYDIIARIKGWKTIMWPGAVQVSAPTPPSTTPPSTVGVGSGSSPYSSTGGDSSYTTLGITGPTGPTGPGGLPSGTAPPPPLLWEWWYGSPAMAGVVDGTGTTVVPAMNAPLSAGNQGAYGMQWWMYIMDWNYGYGKEKPIIVRPDATNSAVMNPRVVLHPTDNSLRISVSIFPSDESGSVSEPAAAGHAGSTDDVFICEVPNIPLQSWFSVSLTVFERNLDVYLNGMLVKSCFMSGVPKPAVGDIQVTPEGGFSGMVCGLTTTNKMLNPSDALAFYTSDTSCHTTSDKPTAAINTTGYSVKFGVYDTVGRQVREYTF